MPSLDPFFDNDPLLAPPINPIQPQAVIDKEILTSMGLLSCNEENDEFNDDDAWLNEGKNITGERNAFNVFVDEDDDLQIFKVALLLQKMFRQRTLNYVVLQSLTSYFQPKNASSHSLIRNSGYTLSIRNL